MYKEALDVAVEALEEINTANEYYSGAKAYETLAEIEKLKMSYLESNYTEVKKLKGDINK